MSHGWGPSYGDPSHPTTGELPKVGDGVRGTAETRAVQTDQHQNQGREPSRPRPRWGASDPGAGWDGSAPRQDREPPSARAGWGPAAPSEPHAGAWGGPAPQAPSQPHSASASPSAPPAPSEPQRRVWSPRTPQAPSEPRGGSWGPSAPQEPSAPRAGRDDTAQFAQVGDKGHGARVGDGMRGSVGPITVQIDQVQVDGVTGDTQLLPRAAYAPPKNEEPPPAAESRQPVEQPKNMPARRKQMGPDWTHMPLRLLAATVVALGVLGASAASLIYIAEWINP